MRVRGNFGRSCMAVLYAAVPTRFHANHITRSSCTSCLITSACSRLHRHPIYYLLSHFTPHSLRALYLAACQRLLRPHKHQLRCAVRFSIYAYLPTGIIYVVLDASTLFTTSRTTLIKQKSHHLALWPASMSLELNVDPVLSIQKNYHSIHS